MMAALNKSRIASVSDLANAKYTPIILNRVSTSQQRKGLPTQQAFMRKTVKPLGFTKKPVEITVAQTGKAADLKTIKQLKQIIDNGTGPYAVFIRDIPRFGRNTRNNLAVIEDVLKPAGVPVIPLDMYQVVGAHGSPENWLVFTFLSAVAESGKASEERSREEGQKEAGKRGLKQGAPKGLNPELFKRGKSLQRRIYEAMPAIANGNLSNKQLARDEGLYPRHIKENRLRLERAIDNGIIDDYLAVIDAIVTAERTRGVGARDRSPAVTRTRKAKALHRVTVAYLAEPELWPNPLTEGNPQTATFQKDLATGTIQDALDNPQRYQPPR